MKINSCRICNNKGLIEIGSLGNIAISDFTEKPKRGVRLPLTLVFCPSCTLLQLDLNIPRHLLYKNYWYQSHLNPVIDNDLREIAGQTKGDSIIDIGSNDGTLLSYSQAKIKIAVDPSNIQPIGHNIIWVQDYWENVKLHKADTITSIACLYDLPDPNAFIKNVKDHLETGGIFIAQLMTLQPMIEQVDIGNICHEHLEYYSYKSLVRLYEQNGLEIYKVEANNINGGSYRLFARHLDKGSVVYNETEYSVDDLKEFFRKVEKNKKDMKQFAKGKTIYGFGASTKGNTILQYYGVKVKGIVDVNPQKLGKYTVETGIPIISDIPKDCQYLWVFPYGFLSFFMDKEKDYKGKWIVTMPEFKIF
jgi:NDP-4-keto-2,6-dideoxyhexose 3-C-methyltransferase